MSGKENNNIRQFLFKGLEGCNSGYCVIKGVAEGLHSNSECNCIKYMNTTKLSLLQTRLSWLLSPGFTIGE